MRNAECRIRKRRSEARKPGERAPWDSSSGGSVLQRRRRQSELEGGERLARVRGGDDRRDPGRDVRPTADRALPRGQLRRPRNGAPKALRQAGNNSTGEVSDLRAQGRRGRDNLVGAQRRGHRQHCQNLSMPASQLHRSLMLGRARPVGRHELSIGPSPRQAPRPQGCVRRPALSITSAVAGGFATTWPSGQNLRAQVEVSIGLTPPQASNLRIRL
jgi:hypothetical protein